MSVDPLDAKDIFYSLVCNLNILYLEIHEAGKFHKGELADYDNIEPEPETEYKIDISWKCWTSQIGMLN